MKNVFFIGLISMLMLLPPCLAGAEAWAEFVARAEAALAEADDWAVVEAGEVEIYHYRLDEDTGRCLPLDPALSVPGSKQLVIRGGSFAGMLMGRGEGLLTLEQSTVRSTVAGCPAIRLLGSSEPVHLNLELGEGTLVEATGANTPAIANLARARGDYPDREVSVTIINHGDIRGTDTAEGGAITLKFGNDGEETVHLLVINGGQLQAPVCLDAYSRGNSGVTLQNREDGQIVTGSFPLWLDAYSQLGHAAATLENQGVMRTLRPDAGPGNPAGLLYLTVNWSDYEQEAHGPDATGKIFFFNRGELAGHTRLGIWMPLSQGNTLHWRQEGPARAVPITAAWTLGWDVPAGLFPDAALLWTAQDWLQREAPMLPALPADTPLSMQLILTGGEDGWVPYPDRPWTKSWADWNLPTD